MNEGLFTFLVLAGALPAIVVVAYAVIQFGFNISETRQHRLAAERRRREAADVPAATSSEH